MIYESEQKNWKDLQNKVAEILNESEINAEVEYHPTSVRSDIEIDVYACEKIGKRNNIFIIECKNWNHKIPQAVVHSVRTVIQDVGGNTGYIISKKVFQKGVYEAAKLTNVKLLTWDEFQDLFEDQWRKTFLNKYIEQTWRKIIDHSDHFFLPKWYTDLTEDKKDDLKNACRVLLTRARQGLIIYIPEGNDNAPTTHSSLYNGTYEYFKSIGIKEI